MRQSSRSLTIVLSVLIVAGTLAGLVAARKRFHVEAGNRRVEIGVEWAEISQLAQAAGLPVEAVLTQFKAQGMQTLILNEETLSSLEQTGAILPQRMTEPDGRYGTRVVVDSPVTLSRIQRALTRRGLPFTTTPATIATRPPTGGTLFTLENSSTGSEQAHTAKPDIALTVPVQYANIHLGLGLTPDGLAAAKKAQMRIAGRIGNYPGVSETNAEAALRFLKAQGASTVIFLGDDVLGYRGLEKSVAAMLRDPAAKSPLSQSSLPAIGLTYGAVEFGKQRGDETLTAALHGDFVRVHSIQLAEQSQLSEDEIIERFAKAARERNIRFCYVRLFTTAGNDPVGENVQFLKKIAKSMERGGEWTGGGLDFGAARRYAETSVPKWIFILLGLGAAAGTVWMAREFCPLPEAWLLGGLLALGVVCAGLTATGETGRKLVALLAGIAFPAAACLRTFPRTTPAEDVFENGFRPSARNKRSGQTQHVAQAVRAILLASGITALGIVHVVGLLATRPFMVRADQFLGIKAQHAVPLLIVALAALLGGPLMRGETWERYRLRAGIRLRAAWDEPARFGVLLLGVIALAALALVVARTGNDAGVGVSGWELKGRAVLDRVLPVRPRTKEFLVGHPFFVLGVAWWLRGRKRLAIPCFVAGSLGQVSLLNTFCHIHTPLVISFWRDLIGLALGTLLGVVAFVVVETLIPKRPLEPSILTKTASSGQEIPTS